MVKLNLISLEQRRKLSHYLKIMYQGICSCGNNYVSETMRNANTRIVEHEKSNDKSETSKHLKNNVEHKLNGMVLLIAPSHTLKRKILVASFIKQLNPSLNDQLDIKILILCRHGVN